MAVDTRKRRSRLRSMLIGTICLAGPSSHAIEADPDEKARLEACEVRICDVVLDRKPPRGPTTCALSKTWIKRDIGEGAGSKALSWGFGDAQCSLDLKLDNATLIKALTLPSFETTLPRHTVRCRVETGEGIRAVEATLAPRLTFSEGRVEKIWVNLDKLDGPDSVTGLVNTALTLENTIGLFQSGMVGGVNKFLHEKCAKGRAERARLARREAMRAAREKRLEAAAARRAAAEKRRAEAEPGAPPPLPAPATSPAR
ncbi:MAG: hypothetical protein NW205_02360 [Hyphomicrobiaceae bacterium]|nr:hypothetical protein [Hyphomicrobiaceae bacterium]